MIFGQKLKPKGVPILMDIITLLKDFVSGLLQAEENFLGDLNTFPELEQTASELSRRMAADFIGLVLSDADRLIRESGLRRRSYTVQRSRSRTLISSVGDITFTHTLYKDAQGKTRCLLDELIRLPDRERFTVPAEAKLLNEAELHSYQHAADSLCTNSQTITKTTVMNKVHAVEEEIPEMDVIPEEKKPCEYLYIEADEDHIHRQEDGKEHGCFTGKLVYLFEGKESVCKDRRKLVAPFYFGGLYAGPEQNAALWEKVDRYIRDHYDEESLKCVYISSDGGGWIRSAAEYIGKGKLVADRYHLMKYINRVARHTGENEKATKGRFYKYIYKNKLLAAKKLLTRIQNHYEGSMRATEECRSYLEGNWEAIQRAFHDRHVLGCSAEGHVSSVYSERMSSRPMGWSETGADRMCRLRCFVRNYGREKVTELVKYRREKALAREAGKELATGTEGLIEEVPRRKYTKEQKELYSYAERLHATISERATVRKILAIREQIGNI